MNPDMLAQICDIVDSRLYRPVEPPWYIWERMLFRAAAAWEGTLSCLFPPKPLHELGPVDGTSLGYAYRMSRTEGYERNIAEINMAVKIEPVGRTPDGKLIYAVEGEPPPPKPPRGTRESRMAKIEAGE